MAANPPSASDLATRGAGALVVAVLLNAAIVFFADLAEIAPALDPLSYGPVALFTALGVVGATVVSGVLTRLVENPDRTFLGVAVVVFLLSLVPDVVYAPTLPGATTAGVVLLAAMHATTAGVCVAMLTDTV